MDADFCVMALEEAIARFGKPEIFNTDPDSQFISFAFTNTLRNADIRISMDGRGRLVGQRLHRHPTSEDRVGSIGIMADPSSDPGSCLTAGKALRKDSFVFRRSARRGLCYAGKRKEIGGVIEPRIHLSQAAILSHKAGPPLTCTRHIASVDFAKFF